MTTILFAIDQNPPTVFGFPLALLLVSYCVWKMTMRADGHGRTGEYGRFLANKVNIRIRGDVSPEVVLFQHSEQQTTGGKCVIRYTIQLKQKGTFVIAGGCFIRQSFKPGHYGTRSVSGDKGEVISGAVSCPAFYTGNWSIGAFRSSHEIPVG